jgi:anti-sigma regulatory factor (Ser/Thr protein kinase)
MADGPYPGGSAGHAGRGDRVRQEWPVPADADGLPPLLDLSVDTGTLHTARARTRACADWAGFGEDQTEDVVLALHELAANVIRHGGGKGRLRVWDLAGALYCQVDDGDASDFAVNSLPCEPGHGLWVVRQVASQMQTLSSAAGTSVQVRFDRTAGGVSRR